MGRHLAIALGMSMVLTACGQPAEQESPKATVAAQNPVLQTKQTDAPQKTVVTESLQASIAAQNPVFQTERTDAPQKTVATESLKATVAAANSALHPGVVIDLTGRTSNIRGIAEPADASQIVSVTGPALRKIRGQVKQADPSQIVSTTDPAVRKVRGEIKQPDPSQLVYTDPSTQKTRGPGAGQPQTPKGPNVTHEGLTKDPKLSPDMDR